MVWPPYCSDITTYKAMSIHNKASSKDGITLEEAVI